MTTSRLTVLFSRPNTQLTDAFKVLSFTRFNLIGLPTITIEKIDNHTEINQALHDLKSFDYLVFTSQYAVINTMAHLKRLGVSPLALQHMTICSVGPMVSQQLNQFNLSSQIMPNEYTAKALSDLFPTIRKNSKRVLFPKGNRALGTLEKSLSRKGYNIMAPIVYKTEYKNNISPIIESISLHTPIDCIALTSPSSALSFASSLNDKIRSRIIDTAEFCAIGPSTKNTCLDIGWEVNISPTEYTVQSMARAIAKHFRKKPRKIQNF